MHPEDRLDALLTAPQRVPRAPTVDTPGDLAPLVEAGRRLGALRQAEPEEGFARALEERWLARAEVLATQPSQGAALGARLWRHSRWDAHQRSHRPRWLPLAAAALLLLVVGVGTLTAAASALPGSPLYGMHRLEQSIRAQLASNAADRADLHLAYASQALSALSAAATQHDMRAYRDALATLRAELAAARAAVGQMPAGQPHDERVAALANLITRAETGLLAALAEVDWGQRLATTDALGGLGLPVVTVESARIVEQNRGGRETWVITLTGSGFQPGAQVLLDGQAVSGMADVTPTALHLTVSSPPDAPLQAVGVQNPDSTAAETRHVSVIIAAPGKDPTPASTPVGNNGGGEKHGGHSPTPTVAPTHTAGAH